MDFKYALWLVPSGPDAEAIRYLMMFRPRPERPKSETPKDTKPKETKPKDNKSKGGKSDDGKSKDGKSQAGKSQAGKSKNGKSNDGKSQAGKSQAGKPKDAKVKSEKSSTHSTSVRSISASSTFSYPRTSFPRPSHLRRYTRSYPRFDPHITLATFWCPHRPSIFQFVPSGAKTTPVQFESMEVGDHFLNSLSIVVAKSEGLMQLRDRIMDHLKANNIRATYPSPHMSLFYLDESFKGERALLCKQLKETGRVHERKGGDPSLTLNCTVDGAWEFDGMRGFEGMEIWLVDVTEGVEDWTILERWYLKPRMPKAKVYVKTGDPYVNIFGNEGPDPYEVREMASYFPSWGDTRHYGMYGPMAPHLPQDPRYYTHNYAQWEDPRMRRNMYAGMFPGADIWGHGPNMYGYDAYLNF